jgi:hypothetical protein
MMISTRAASTTAAVATSVLLVFALAGPNIAMAQQQPQFVGVQQPQLTREQQQTQASIESTIGLTTHFLKNTVFGGLKFDQIWSPVEWIEPASYGIIIVDCPAGAYALSSMHIWESSKLAILESYPIALPSDLMSWIFLVQNTDNNERLPTVGGVICVSEQGKPVTTVLRPDLDQQINNIVKQIIIVQNKITDVKQIINIKQIVNQIAIQVAQAGGNVDQTVNQIAGQVAAGGAQGAKVDQFIGQLANQTATGNSQAVNQTINQFAGQLARTGNDASQTSQTIQQFANQIVGSVSSGGGGGTTGGGTTGSNSTTGNTNSTSSSLTTPPIIHVPQETSNSTAQSSINNTATNNTNLQDIIVNSLLGRTGQQ